MSGSMQKTPKPPPPRPGALNTLGRVREELGKIYRDARVGDLDIGEASKLAHILQILSRLLEADEQDEWPRI